MYLTIVKGKKVGQYWMLSTWNEKKRRNFLLSFEVYWHLICTYISKWQLKHTHSWALTHPNKGFYFVSCRREKNSFFLCFLNFIAIVSHKTNRNDLIKKKYYFVYFQFWQSLTQSVRRLGLDSVPSISNENSMKFYVLIFFFLVTHSHLRRRFSINNTQNPNII